jgi:hypothetical protein
MASSKDLCITHGRAINNIVPPDRVRNYTPFSRTGIVFSPEEENAVTRPSFPAGKPKFMMV